MSAAKRVTLASLTASSERRLGRGLLPRVERGDQRSHRPGQPALELGVEGGLGGTAREERIGGGELAGDHVEELLAELRQAWHLRLSATRRCAGGPLSGRRQLGRDRLGQVPADPDAALLVALLDVARASRTGHQLATLVRDDRVDRDHLAAQRVGDPLAQLVEARRRSRR